MLDKLIKAENKKTYMKAYYENNKEKRKEQRKKYSKKYYKQNKEQNKEKKKEYRNQHKEEMKEYRNQHKDKIKERMKEYSKEHRNSFALYNSYVYQISYAEEVRRDSNNEELLQVKCTYCKEWFNPTIKSVQNRIAALDGKLAGEHRLYCSEECKKLCPVYGQQKYPKDQKPYPLPRDMQKEWADMVKERDGYRCIKCGSTENLIAHHKEGIRWNPIESADIDLGVTLCEKCNEEAHSIEGCSTYDMRCIK